MILNEECLIPTGRVAVQRLNGCLGLHTRDPAQWVVATDVFVALMIQGFSARVHGFEVRG